jgi:hypothetical protein
VTVSVVASCTTVIVVGVNGSGVAGSDSFQVPAKLGFSWPGHEAGTAIRAKQVNTADRAWLMTDSLETGGILLVFPGAALLRPAWPAGHARRGARLGPIAPPRGG